jgi:hypothetical protein
MDRIREMILSAAVPPSVVDSTLDGIEAATRREERPLPTDVACRRCASAVRLIVAAKTQGYCSGCVAILTGTSPLQGRA